MSRITVEKLYINAIYLKKAFSQKAYLTEHTRIHTGETPYQCIQCPFAFSQQNHLKKHIRIHSGDKPYQCNYCEKFF